MSINSSNLPLKSFAVSPSRQPPYLDWKRAPTTADKQYPGTRVQDSSVTPAVIYETTGAGVWYDVTPGSGMVSSLKGNDGLSVTPAAGIIEILGTGGVTTSRAAADTLQIDVVASDVTWAAAIAVQPATADSGYFAGINSAITLPSAPANGTVFKVIVTAAALTVSVAGSGGATVQLDDGGAAQATWTSTNQQGGVMELVYDNPNNIWYATNTKRTWS